jgi:hypothetical protein
MHKRNRNELRSHGQPGRLSLGFASAKKTDFRIPGNHRAGDDQYDDHDNEFHLSLTMLPSPSNSQRSAYVLLQRRQVTQVQAGG